MNLDDFKKIFDFVPGSRKNEDLVKRGPTSGKMQSGKTRRGAKHKVGGHFKPRKIYPISPAQYRRFHFGDPKTDRR